MYWIGDVQKAIDYIEENLLAAITPEEVANAVYSSRDHFHKLFSAVTGFSVSEYIRNRRLSLAGQELAAGKTKVIDAALKYRYETPESFAKAFARFHGAPPSSMRTRERLQVFDRITLQINIRGGFNMSVKLDVRSVGFLDALKDDPRAPESFALPACVTSLMEYLGEDVKWTTIHAHNREYKKRMLNDAILAATGMAFGLLWYKKEICPSSFDLTQVNDHNVTIRLAFDYVGFDCEIVEKTGSNLEEMKELITASIDAGRPVLAFGVVGPPECSIVCGYDSGGDTLFGWSHFQSRNPADNESNGMFRTSDWYGDIWKIVLCGKKKEPDHDLRGIVRRGIAITEAEVLGLPAASGEELDAYLSGRAAYDAWASYVLDPAYEDMGDDALRGKFWFHSTLTGNHAEARCYLGGFLGESAGEDEALRQIAGLYDDIHSTCWEIWGVSGGIGNQEGYLAFRDPKKREELAALIRKIKALDFEAVDRLKAWLSK